LICAEGSEQNAALCYPPCGDGYQGVGPVCWGGCPEGLISCGALCLKDAVECASKVAELGKAGFDAAAGIADAEDTFGLSLVFETAPAVVELLQGLTLPICS
jgi:hypothetical protein